MDNAVFDIDTSCTRFLEMLNSQHKNIKFSIGKATDAKTLNFLDVEVCLSALRFNTCDPCI